MLRLIGLFFVLALMWWLWSGLAIPLLLILGLASCLLVVWISYRMDVVDSESTPLHLTHRAPLYWCWLMWQMLRSNLDVCRRILLPATTVEPVVTDISTPQKTALGKTVHANSITLTPGTLSMRVVNSSVQIHALHPELVKRLLSGELARRVRHMD